MLKGAGLNNEAIDASQYRGKTLLVAFWATWAEPVKRDLPELTKLYQKYRSQGLEIVGVSLDNDRKDLDEFLKENPLPWPQIFEPGGMEGRLAGEFGIISLPTMFLVDAAGQGRQPQHPHRRRAPARAREGVHGRQAGGRPRGEVTFRGPPFRIQTEGGGVRLGEDGQPHVVGHFAEAGHPCGERRRPLRWLLLWPIADR